MSVVRQFASAQLDRQKASLTTNAGHEAADRAALVTNLHRTALEAALAHADTKQDLTIDTLKQWHSLLCRGGLVPEAGRLRTRNVRAGPTDFCPPEQVPLELDKLCKGIGALGSRLVGSNSPATLAAAVCFGVHPHYGADPNERPSGLCGICRYFPRDVLYAPIKFQGVGLKNIYIMMGLLRVDLIASEGKANSITGDLVRTSIEATKLELGLPSSLFESDFKNLVNSQQSAGLRTLGNSWQNSTSP
jgi:hypothetical protein